MHIVTGTMSISVAFGILQKCHSREHNNNPRVRLFYKPLMPISFFFTVYKLPKNTKNKMETPHF